MTKRSGGQLVVQVLEQQGVKKVFCVPGESYLGILDALYQHPHIQLISNRHEGGASFMAEGYAKASGDVGICMATRAVGAANLAIGLHTAYQDSTPLVALIGDVERPYQHKEAFQEIDLAGIFRHLCKWSVQIREVERIPELLHRAFYTARSGRPGPVVVALPHDMLEDLTDDRLLTNSWSYHSHQPDPSLEDICRIHEELTTAKQPIVIAGGGVTRSDAVPLLVESAEKFSLPVATAFRRFDAFPNEHRCYAGWLGFQPSTKLVDYIHQADVVLALGTRFSQVTSQDYRLIKPDTRLLHVDISPDVFGKVFPPAIAVESSVKNFLGALLNWNSAHPSSVQSPDRTQLISNLHSEYIKFSAAAPNYSDQFVDLEGAMHDLVRHVPQDSIVSSDAGNFFGWVCRYFRFVSPTTYIGPTSGAMGYGLPAAIGAKLAHPDKTVVSFSGDGGFMMTMQELETAVRCQIPVLAIVVNNNMYGTIRAHQEKNFPKRTIGTDLTNPNFAELARLFGAFGRRVEKNADFVPALKEALAQQRPAVLELLTNPALLSVSQRRSSIST